MYSHQQEQTQHRRHNQACHPCRRAPPPTQHRRSPHLCRNRSFISSLVTSLTLLAPHTATRRCHNQRRRSPRPRPCPHQHVVNRPCPTYGSRYSSRLLCCIHSYVSISQQSQQPQQSPPPPQQQQQQQQQPPAPMAGGMSAPINSIDDPNSPDYLPPRKRCEVFYLFLFILCFLKILFNFFKFFFIILIFFKKCLVV